MWMLRVFSVEPTMAHWPPLRLPPSGPRHNIVNTIPWLQRPRWRWSIPRSCRDCGAHSPRLRPQAAKSGQLMTCPKQASEQPINHHESRPRTNVRPCTKMAARRSNRRRRRRPSCIHTVDVDRRTGHSRWSSSSSPASCPRHPIRRRRCRCASNGSRQEAHRHCGWKARPAPLACSLPSPVPRPLPTYSRAVSTHRRCASWWGAHRCEPSPQLRPGTGGAGASGESGGTGTRHQAATINWLIARHYLADAVLNYLITYLLN